ncbi:pantoate--beta-alanine ligase [Urechidicola vernalis]|uniref:Pantothenate synthetase n=1 Tax=Urechidicola vernalis TaxID=3075600 RepID=A0ABU2Y639_9FLAO|nr:pantoate--beta-alanine ligase [Urechidicola sp. P050]MDT0553668.1 pantoate--beta-alanine ligase [Urechidicola sp. P050]
MLVFETIKKLQQHLSSASTERNIGFVPTMGALHDGHLSLIEKAKTENDLVVVSIFVNPTQFNNADDLINYPKTIDADLQHLENIDCDVVFTPSPKEMYGDNSVAEKFDFNGLENQMEGAFRTGHFDGVGTIVKRLFEVVKPTNAYFGEKDFQQLQIIRKLVEKFNIPVHIHGCDIFREDDGLAMSSRNVRLTGLERKETPLIYSVLKTVKAKFNTTQISEINDWVVKEFDKSSVLNLEYFQIANESNLIETIHRNSGEKYRAFIAINVGEVRLIDNIAL